MTPASLVRRALALHADADQLALAAPFAEQFDGDIAALVEYMFDPRAGAILATSDARAAWLASPLFVAVGPGNYAPADDRIAALLVGPVLAKGGSIAPAVIARRFAPRADDAIAIAAAALPPEARLATLDQLARDPGPDPQLLALSAVQCGRVLAWSPRLLDTPQAERIVGALVELLSASRPKPLLELVARALGPIAATDAPLAARVREAALAVIEAAHRPPRGSFAAEIAAIGKTRTLPDQDRMMALPAREAAAAAAYILGFASPAERDRFRAHRALVLDRPDGELLLEPFVDGLVAAAHVPAVVELADALLDEGGANIATALGLAAALPLDPLAAELAAELDAESPLHRVLACGAVELLESPDIDQQLALRLGDPSPEVAAAAARTLVARARHDLVAAHAERDAHPIRNAIARAATGELRVPVIGELVRGLLSNLDGEPADASPIALLLADVLLGSVDGLETAANLVGGVPEAAAVLALAAAPATERDVAVLAPPGPRALLASVTLRIATDANAGPELGTLALYLLARVSAGDATVAEVIANALAADDGSAAGAGYAGQLVAALGELRVADERTAAALAPLLARDQPIGGRVLAAAVCGRALPHDHPAWSDVRELLELGTIARAAAWSALRDRARRH